jgi:hypothetical protein
MYCFDVLDVFSFHGGLGNNIVQFFVTQFSIIRIRNWFRIRIEMKKCFATF